MHSPVVGAPNPGQEPGRCGRPMRHPQSAMLLARGGSGVAASRVSADSSASTWHVECTMGVGQALQPPTLSEGRLAGRRSSHFGPATCAAVPGSAAPYCRPRLVARRQRPIWQSLILERLNPACGNCCSRSHRSHRCGVRVCQSVAELAQSCERKLNPHGQASPSSRSRSEPPSAYRRPFPLGTRRAVALKLSMEPFSHGFPGAM